MNLILYLLIGVVAFILLIVVSSGLRVVQQYERGVIFQLGRLQGAKGPGLFWIWPFITRMRRIDLRIVTLEVAPQEVITRDNVTLKVTAVVYFYVVDPAQAVVEVKDVELPATMQRAMARQAEAEREKRAKIIHADGEAQAASNLAEAGRVIASQPAALQLRYLQTLTEIAAEKNSTIVLTDIAGFLTQVSGTGQHSLEALRATISDVEGHVNESVASR